MITPRPYLSFSQMTLFEQSPERYAEQYLYGKKQKISRNIKLGSMLADGLENEEATGDPLLDLVAARLPKFELMDKPVEGGKNSVIVWSELDKKHYMIPTLPDKKGKITEYIPIFAKPDTATADYSKFKEYKTSTRRWTQRMVDESGQISFYATAIWLVTCKIPQDIELVCAGTAYDKDGTLSVTGEIWHFPTKRSMTDVIKMTSRMRAAWKGINELCERELL